MHGFWLFGTTVACKCNLHTPDVVWIHLKQPVVPTNTHTHTHRHVGFYGWRGLSIGVMVLYCTNCMCYCPISTLLHLNLALTGETVHFCFPPKNELCMIYKHIELWGHWKCPNKSPSSCNKCHTHVIIQICVLINHINMHTHTQIRSLAFHTSTSLMLKKAILQ